MRSAGGGRVSVAVFLRYDYRTIDGRVRPLSVSISILVHEDGAAGTFDYVHGLLKMLKVRHLEQPEASRTGNPAVSGCKA